jgi:hypothetical protein
MFRLMKPRVLAALCLAVAVSACDDAVTPTQPTPTNPVTQTFTGSLVQNAAQTHDFAVAAGGAVKATLTAIGADNTVVVGLSLGNWNSTSSSCSIVLANDAATGGSILEGTMTAAGALCVRVYDVGNLVGSTPVTYSIEVVHP